MSPQQLAERELRDALVRYVARLRGTLCDTPTMLAGWAAAVRAELEVVTVTQDGLTRCGSPRALAIALDLDPDQLGVAARGEVDHAAAMLELHDFPSSILPPKGGE